jgi:hypothetical protein
MPYSQQFAHFLGISDPDWAECHRVGFRTRAVMSSKPGVNHRFREESDGILLKLYKGKGQSPGGAEYLQYHGTDFQRVTGLGKLPRVQRSLEAGIFADIPYAVSEFIEGEELRTILEREELKTDEALEIIRQILDEIWIPIWNLGLRFKDTHPGNFVRSPERGVIMIDTDQLRKSVSELLRNETSWEQRNKHETQGLSRMSGLVERVLKGAGSQRPRKKRIIELIEVSGISESFHRLGREPEALSSAMTSAKVFQDLLQKELC